MKKIFIAIAILYSVSSTAQDIGDHVDTRRKTESFAKLPKDQIRTDLASFTLSGISESIGKAEFKKIPFTAFGNDFMTFEGDNIKATIKSAPFDPAKHKLMFDDDEKFVIKIDRKAYYGGYGTVPFTYISNITLTVDGDTVNIPPAAYADLYNINFTYNDKGVQRSTSGIYRSKDGHRIYIYVFSKDNKGSYEVTWVIQDKQYLRRVLDYGFM
ncbi:MAG: hypothetical protein M3015_05125 [Bacteroidota bacterium]|nr:hypothetical protein [Bacteroidota bacterium]